MNRNVFNKLLVVCCSNDDLFWKMRSEGSQHNHMVRPVFSVQAFGYGAFIVWYQECWLSEDKDACLEKYSSVFTEEELTDLVECCQMYDTFLKRADTEVFQKSTSIEQLTEASRNLLKEYYKDADSAWLAFWTLENFENNVTFVSECWKVCQEPCTYEYKNIRRIKSAGGYQFTNSV